MWRFDTHFAAAILIRPETGKRDHPSNRQTRTDARSISRPTTPHARRISALIERTIIAPWIENRSRMVVALCGALTGGGPQQFAGDAARPAVFQTAITECPRTGLMVTNAGDRRRSPKPRVQRIAPLGWESFRTTHVRQASSGHLILVTPRCGVRIAWSCEKPDSSGGAVLSGE
jgi:hypothetical protein